MKIIVTVEQEHDGEALHAASISVVTDEIHIGEIAREAHTAVYAALVAAGFHPAQVDEYFGTYES